MPRLDRKVDMAATDAAIVEVFALPPPPAKASKTTAQPAVR